MTTDLDAATMATLGLAERRSRALLDLVDQALPIQLQEPNGHDNWPITATALVARSANLVEVILAVQPLHQRLEGTALHRILHEHVTTFAWLAIDPPTRMERWLASDAGQRLSTADDMKRLEGSDPMPTDARQEMERRATAKMLPSLVDMAAAVDLEWSPRLPELSAPKGHYASFRGMYTGVFREGSAFIHARTYGIEPLVSSSDLQMLVSRARSRSMLSTRSRLHRSHSRSDCSSAQKCSVGQNVRRSTRSSTNCNEVFWAGVRPGSDP